jgi:UDP-N-acetylmuramate dehydrogenase
VPDLTSLHTFRLPSSCRRIIDITSADLLTELDIKPPFCLLGEGSNTIFIENFSGDVLLMKIKGVVIEERNSDHLVHCAAGENWHDLVIGLLERGIAGLENLVLIPGTVGAAPVQNIGAYGVEVKQFIDYVEGVDLRTRQIVRLANQQCHFGYRDSIFKHELKDNFVITQVGFALPKQWRPVLSYGPLTHLDAATVTANEVAKAVIAVRQSKLPDPAIIPNAGSFFKNPIVNRAVATQLAVDYPTMPIYPVDDNNVKLAAGWLMEQAGLKGYQQHGIGTYDQQALVLVNHGATSSAALLFMIKHIQTSVLVKFNVHLDHEVRLIGQNGEITVQVN